MDPKLMNGLVQNRDYLLAGLDEGWLGDYDWLTKRVWEIDVSQDPSYQGRFGHFYGFRGIPSYRREGRKWRKVYFRMLQDGKRYAAPTVDVALLELPTLPRNKRVFLSWASKLIATLDPDKPVYDAYVRRSLRLSGVSWKVIGGSYEAAIENYHRLVVATSALVSDPDFAVLRGTFDERFSRFAHFTDMKKLDLYLWRLGKELS